MVFACLYLIVGNFLRAGRAAPAMAAGLRGAAHPFMFARKTLCSLPSAPPAPDPGRAQAAPLSAAWDTRESSARVFSTVERSRVPENRIVLEQI